MNAKPSLHLAILWAVFLSGCAAIGPTGSSLVERFDYSGEGKTPAVLLEAPLPLLEKLAALGGFRSRDSLEIRTFNERLCTDYFLESRLPPVSIPEDLWADYLRRAADVYYVHHILVSDSQLCTNLASRLAAGADFASLAKNYSRDPGSAENGGELPGFRPSEAVFAFEQAVFSLRPGEVSGVVETPFGFHLIRLDSVGVAASGAVPEEKLRAHLERSLREQARRVYLKELFRRHGVRIWMSRWGTPDTLAVYNGRVLTGREGRRLFTKAFEGKLDPELMDKEFRRAFLENHIRNYLLQQEAGKEGFCARREILAARRRMVLLPAARRGLGMLMPRLEKETPEWRTASTKARICILKKLVRS